MDYRPHHDDDEAQEDPVFQDEGLDRIIGELFGPEFDVVVGHRIFKNLKDALAYARQVSDERMALRPIQPCRPDHVDGVISPDSRPPRDYCAEFQRLMLGTAWGRCFLNDADTKLSLRD